MNPVNGLIRLDGKSFIIAFRLSDVWAYSVKIDPVDSNLHQWRVFLTGGAVCDFELSAGGIDLQRLIERYLQGEVDWNGEPIPQKKGARK